MKLSGVSKYVSPVRYWYRFLSLVNKTILHHFDMLTAPAYETQFKYPPIFFLGAPRSGTTLIYQVVTDRFDVAYLSNRHCQFFGAPALAERLFRPLNNKTCSDYTSYHGQTKGLSSPSECGEWWYRFFRREPAFVTLVDADEKKMGNFRRSLLALTEVAGKPVVFKNLYASLRLEAISKHIPEALFIVIKRNELDNSHSLLEGRMRTLGRYDQWWGVPPPNVEKLKLLEPAQQAVGQVRGMCNVIDKAMESGLIDSRRVLTLEYEKFCADVYSSVRELEKFFMTHGLTVSRRFTVPEKFPINRNIRIDKKLYSELQRIVNS